MCGARFEPSLAATGKGRRRTSEASKSPGDPNLAQVVRACEERLNPPAQWYPFEGYRGSLALCVLDAIWSVSARYPDHARRHRALEAQRRWQGNPDEDALPHLLAFYEAIGGVDSFIDEVGT